MNIVGLDLGKAQDYSAISVLGIVPTKYQKTVQGIDPELNVRRDQVVTVEGPPLMNHVRHVERLPIGTSYPQVVNRVIEVLHSLPVGAWLVVDNTGVGQAVTDLIIQAGLRPICVYITGGNTVTYDETGWYFNVPKRDLVEVLRVAFQSKRIKINSRIPDVKTLVNELQNFKIKINQKTAHDSYEAWREGDHDDLVIAVAMASWAAHFHYSQPRTETHVLKDDYVI
jgi:hypothetical protein